MMNGENMSDFFKFENEKIDFPFYKDNPFLSTKEWLVLLAGALTFIGILAVPIKIDPNLTPFLLCLSVLLPSLYVCKGKFKLLFRKVEKKDLKLIIICLIAYYIYAIAMGFVLDYLNMAPGTNVVFNEKMDIVFWIGAFIQLLGEELYKVSSFLIILHVIFKITHKRKLSVICGVIITLLSFGLLHYNAYEGAVVHIILTIGLGGIFYFYAYLKTKNVMVGYIVHLLIDGIPFLFATLVQIFGL